MSSETPKRNYYAIIPAFVRYDEDLTPNSKLLYGEITSLCNESGYCWAKNEYFAGLYNVSTTSISKWINSLVRKGYIISEIFKSEDGEKEGRILKIPPNSFEEKLKQPITKVKGNLEKKLKQNNTNIIKEENIKEKATGEDINRWFENIWQIYPKDVDKIQARKTFEHKLRGLPKEEAHKKAIGIYRLLKRHIALWERQGTELQYIKGCSSWLNANIEDSPHFKRRK